MKLRYIGKQAAHLGRADGRLVEPDEVIEVEGDLAKDSPEDAYVIGTGDDARAYPKSVWANSGGSRKSEETA